MATDTNLPDAPHANDGDAATVDLDAASASPKRIVEAEAAGRARVCVARVEQYDDAPDECTIYPVDANASELPTTWVTAEEGSFVALEAMR